jgi:uncharacterized protein with beta-barrel porin domain
MRRTICTGLSLCGRPKELSRLRDRTKGNRPRGLAIAAALALMGVVLTSPSGAQAQDLGTAASFGVLAGSTVTNTGPTIIMGDVGVSPGSAIVGFTGPPNGTVVPPGTIHSADAVAIQAQVDNTTAYNELDNTINFPITQDLTGMDLAGLTLAPGVYGFDSSAQLTGTLVLDGQNLVDPLFIFNIGSTLTTASGSSVSLINGATGANVFWLVGSSATLGTTTSFTGNILALTSITLQTGATITCGRALAQTGAVTLDTNVITIPGIACITNAAEALAEVDELVALIELSDNLTDLLSGGGLTDNQRRVAEAILPTIFSDIGNAVNDALASLSASELAAALNAISGEGVTGAQQTAFGASNMFMSAVMGQATFWRENLGQGRVGPTPPPGPLKLGPSDGGFEETGIADNEPGTWRVWATGFGGTSSLDGNARIGSADLNAPTAGLASGIDYQLTRSAIIGIAGGFSHSDFSVNERRTSGSVEAPQVGLYGVKRLGPFYFAGVAEYANFDNETNRLIVLGGSVPSERAKGKFDSDGFGARIEGGWEFAVDWLNVTPFAGMQWSRLESDGFRENSTTVDGDGGIFGLRFASQDETSRLSSLGLQLDTDVALANGMLLRPFVRVAWLHEFNPDRSIFATMLSLPDASFLVDGAEAASDAARVNTGLKLDLTERTALFGFFDGVFSDQGQSYAGTGGVRFIW